ncbi:MAG: trypsin-like peptidase domain-containing protein [Actinomycetota bacterium]|nr:trypsin-like peptidase domain-containing protein [Actinomycetota bacterium]
MSANPSSNSRPLSTVLAGILGGVVVLVIGAVLISTDVIDTGDTTREVINQPVVGRPAAIDSGDGRTVADIFEEEGRGVVFVQAQDAGSDSPLGGGGEGTSTGSGFLVDDDGTILTNAHVVAGSESVTVSFEDDKGNEIDAQVKGRDESTDLAVLKIDPAEAEGVAPVPLGDSSQAQVGDPVIAIGNPFGFTRTVTTGIVSAVQRRIEAPNSFSIGNVIQTDAAINPGNSGGPLLDAQGRVIGINAQIATNGSQSSSGIGFAIPVNTAKKLLPQLEKGGEIERGYLGVRAADVSGSVAEELDLPVEEGALIQEVVDGGPADRAGLRAGDRPTTDRLSAGGDVIVAIEGEPIRSSSDLVAAVEDLEPGDEIEVELYRGDEKRTETVKLGKRPDEVAQTPQLPGLP